MARGVEFMPLLEIFKPSLRFLYNKVCIQITVFLLGSPDQCDSLIGQPLQLLIGKSLQRIRHGFQPFRHVRILEHGSHEVSFFFLCSHFKIVQAVARLRILY